MLGKRVHAAALTVTAMAAVALPASASGAITFGSNLDDPPSVFTNSGFTLVQRDLDPDNRSPGGVTAPSDGVITGWRVKKDATPTTLALRVVRGNTSVFQSQPTVFPTPAGTYRFDTRVEVQAGDAIGVDQITGTTVQIATLGGSWSAWGPVLGATETRDPVGTEAFQLLLNADLEADCDADGFGDETQDPSTESCEPGAADPPETEITKGAPNKTDKGKVTFRFISDNPSATFECALDQKPFKPCSSPKKVKRLDQGKHKFKVRAIDPAGNVDSSPAKDKFKVVD